MAHFTLFKFQIELSDIERSLYQTLEFRAAQHPSESIPYFLTRVLAFILNFEDDLIFAPTGLHDPDAAAINIPDLSGGFKTLIEIGSPSARKLHKATKSARNVKVYTYKNANSLIEEIKNEKVHRGSEIEIFSISQSFLAEIEPHLKNTNRWSVMFNDGTINIQIGEHAIAGELTKHTLQEG